MVYEKSLSYWTMFHNYGTVIIWIWSFTNINLPIIETRHRCVKIRRLQHHYLIEAEGNLTIINSDNCLSPGQCQAIMRTTAGVLLIGRLGTNFSEISIEIHMFSFKKMHLKRSSAKWQKFCLGPNLLKHFRLQNLHAVLLHFVLLWLYPISYWWIVWHIHTNSRLLHLHRQFAIRQQAMTWANDEPDLYHCMLSLGHNELKPTTITT